MSAPDSKTIMLAAASKTAADEVEAALAGAASNDPNDSRAKLLSGTATVLNGNTSIVAGTFAGLDGSPVQVTPLEAPTAATFWYASWDGSDQLTLHIDANNTADLALSYQIDAR